MPVLAGRLTWETGWGLEISYDWVTRAIRQLASADRNSMLASTNNATVPTTMNMTY